MAILYSITALALAASIGLAITAPIVALDGLVCVFRRKPFGARKRWLAAWSVSTVALAAVILYGAFGIPDRKTFVSPDGAYTVKVAFYADTNSLEQYRFRATLRDANTGRICGEVERKVRDIFVTGRGDRICWETAVRMEWEGPFAAGDKLLLVFPEMNTGYLLPSAERVFPLPDRTSRRFAARGIRKELTADRRSRGG